MNRDFEYEIIPLSPDEEDLIDEKINEFAYSVVPPEPGTPEPEQLVYKAEDGGRVIGGCVVNIHTWGRAVLACLWVDEEFRGQGLASMLIREAQRAAKEKGCYYLCLGTADYHARPLYEKHGFTVFTVNHNVPKGHESWSLSKRLDRDCPDYVPKNNSAASRFTILSGTRENAEIIFTELNRWCEQFVQDEHDDIGINKKLTDPNGNLIAGIVAGVDGGDCGEIDGIWVEEAYRRQGFGSRLLREAEDEARKNGAYILMTYACDWNVGFFTKHGYTVRGELEDYPKGHRAYELQKLL